MMRRSCVLCIAKDQPMSPNLGMAGVQGSIWEVFTFLSSTALPLLKNFGRVNHLMADVNSNYAGC